MPELTVDSGLACRLNKYGRNGKSGAFWKALSAFLAGFLVA